LHTDKGFPASSSAHLLVAAAAALGAAALLALTAVSPARSDTRSRRTQEVASDSYADRRPPTAMEHIR